MQSVGIRELKARLSELVERAAEGESIVITERGKPKAQLQPLSPIQRGIAEGWITPPKRPGGVRGPWKTYKAKRTIQEMMDEDRADRF
ncbi:MAG: type II toxin-antitoxin system prevent-host-death family antitoxin [Gaiellaceae bacterium]